MLSALAPYLSNPRQSASQILNFCLVLSTAFMLWKTLSVITNSPSPIVVVLSGSMEPAFQRGDLLFLWNRDKRAEVGEIVVYNVKGKDIPIVHRVVRSFTSSAAIEASDKYAAQHTPYARIVKTNIKYPVEQSLPLHPSF